MEATDSVLCLQRDEAKPAKDVTSTVSELVTLKIMYLAVMASHTLTSNTHRTAPLPTHTSMAKKQLST